MRKSVISLCDLTGNMVLPWAEAGYECWCVDIQHSIRNDRTVEVGNGLIHYVWGDCRSWTPERRPEIAFAFTPCTHLAGSGARDFAKKRWPMLRDGLDLFHSAVTHFEWAGVPWMAENPVGRIAGIMGKSEHTFHPCDYGDPYSKLTCIWSGGGLHHATEAPSRTDRREQDAQTITIQRPRSQEIHNTRWICESIL